MGAIIDWHIGIGSTRRIAYQGQWETKNFVKASDAIGSESLTEAESEMNVHGLCDDGCYLLNKDQNGNLIMICPVLPERLRRGTSDIRI